ncbi:kinase-like protein [Imleria badia]|nr:kinase-like protein [Imleria badia]
MHITRDGEFPVAAGGCADIYKGTLVGVSQTPIKVHTCWSFEKTSEIPLGRNKSDQGVFRRRHPFQENKSTYGTFLSCHLASDTGISQRLRREVKVWMKLNHPNVLSLFGTTSGFGPFPAMVCPWLENGTLTSYLERCGADLKIVQLLNPICDAASGLQYRESFSPVVHWQSIVHGDLSGSNVLIDANGRARIADFGLSTILDEIGGSTFATSSTGKPRGTLRWAAPELLDLVDHGDAKTQHTGPTTQSDIYSFGSIMLQILSGKIPYHYYSRDMQIIAAISRGVTPTRPDNPHVTDRRWGFIQRCWSPFRVQNVVRRPSTAPRPMTTHNHITPQKAVIPLLMVHIGPPSTHQPLPRRLVFIPSVQYWHPRNYLSSPLVLPMNSHLSTPSICQHPTKRWECCRWRTFSAMVFGTVSLCLAIRTPWKG